MTAPGQNLWNSNFSVANDTAASLPNSSARPSASAISPDVLTLSQERPPRGLSIGLKATALAALFGILPILAVGYIGYRSADHSITETITHHEVEEVEQIASRLQTYMQERVANVNTAARLINAFTASGTSLSAPEDTQTRSILAEQLTQLVETYGSFSKLGVFDAEGKLQLPVTGTIDSDQGDRDYFSAVLTTKAAVISEPVLSEADANEQSISIAAPVLDAEGNVDAVVVAQVQVEQIGESVLGTGVSEAEAEEESEVYRLVDSAGRIIQSLPAVPEEPEVGTLLSEQIPDYDNAQSQRDGQVWISSTADGEALVAYAPVEDLGGLQWSVVSASSTKESFEAQAQLLRTILLGTVTTGIAAVLLGIVLTKRAIRPIEQVASTLDLLGQGQLHARVPVRGRDELATLGSTVNQMAEQIQVLLQTLQQNAGQLEKQNDVLAELASSPAFSQGDAIAAARACSAVTAATLGVNCVSIWLYEPDREQLRCLARSSQAAQGEPQETDGGPEVGALPPYLLTLADSKGLAIRDIFGHAEVQALAAEGQLTAGTTSLLEVPIQVGGSLAGTLRCEHVGEPRSWKPQEQIFGISVANLMALALESDVLQREITHLLDVVSEVEGGNLTIQAHVSNRNTGLVADTFNRLIERLGDVLQQALETAQQASESAQQQKFQADNIASNAERQSQEVTQILRIIDGVKDYAQQTAQRVKSSRQSLQALQDTVEQGQNAVAEVTAGIDILQVGSDRIIQQMKTLGEFVGQTDQFVQDQTQIATSTQTLALNASLVAARAAEQRDPRQFAIAAREFGAIAAQVSQLAQQTNDSLTTLEQRSAQIQSVVYAVDADVQQVGSLVDNFTQGIDQSGQAFANVQTVMASAVEAEEAVARASQEIVDAVEAATGVVSQITDIALQTAELTYNNRSQSEEMETLSHQLLETMVFFQLPNSKARDTSRATSQGAVSAAPLA